MVKLTPISFSFFMILGQFEILGVQLKFWEGGEKNCLLGISILLNALYLISWDQFFLVTHFQCQKIPGPHEHK